MSAVTLNSSDDCHSWEAELLVLDRYDMIRHHDDIQGKLTPGILNCCHIFRPKLPAFEFNRQYAS